MGPPNAHLLEASRGCCKFSIILIPIISLTPYPHRTQQLASEAYKERDTALGRYAEVERLRMEKELEADGSPLHRAAPRQQLPQMVACEDCGTRNAEVLCTLCRGRFCGQCSDRIHSGGVMRTHPLRLLHSDAKKKHHSINAQPLSPRSTTELHRLEAKYDKAKDKLKTMKLDWAKLGATSNLLQQAESEKEMLKQYVKRLEAENQGLRNTTGGGQLRANERMGAAALPKAWRGQG